MKPFIPVLFLSLAAIAACSKDDIIYDDSVPAETAQAVTVDCTGLNSDLQALQALAGEAFIGSCVVSVDGTSVEFDSGTVVDVQVRGSYGFDYVNPVVSISGKYWALDGSSQTSEITSSLLQLKGEDGVWYSSFDGGQTWSFYTDIASGSSVPVFSDFTAGELEVLVSLSSGVTFSFEYLEEE